MLTGSLDCHNLTGRFYLSTGRCNDRFRPHRGILCHKYISRGIYIDAAEMINGPHDLISAGDRRDRGNQLKAFPCRQFHIVLI